MNRVLKWLQNSRRRKALLAPMASELLVGYPYPWEWPLSAEHEISVGDVTFRDRYLPQGSEPPIQILYGYIGRRRQPRILLALHEEDNDPATFQRLKEIITETTPTRPEFNDPL